MSELHLVDLGRRTPDRTWPDAPTRYKGVAAMALIGEQTARRGGDADAVAPKAEVRCALIADANRSTS